MGAKAAQERFIKFITKLSGKEHYQCFGCWQRLSIVQKNKSEKRTIDDVAHQMIVTKSALQNTRTSISSRKQHLTLMNKQEKDLVASISWYESELEARYNRPSGLDAVVKALSKSCASLMHVCSTQVVSARANQVERRDRNHVPIHDVYDYGSSEEERNYFVESEDVAGTNEEIDDDVDVAYPFELRTGKAGSYAYKDVPMLYLRVVCVLFLSPHFL